MDKGDWALFISLGSFLVAGASAFYTRRMAIQDAEKMARKAPILEVQNSSPMTEGHEENDRVEYPGYFQASITIRNLEPTASLRLTSIKARGQMKLALRDSFRDPSASIFEYRLLTVLPPEYFKESIDLGRVLQVSGTPSGSYSDGDTCHLSLCSTSPISPKNIALEWDWLDGAKR